jgi:hypothetical protein
LPLLRENISGQVFVLFGKHITLVGRPDVTAHESQFESDAIWTPTSLHEQLGPHFEKKTLGDGYAVPGA